MLDKLLWFFFVKLNFTYVRRKCNWSRVEYHREGLDMCVSSLILGSYLNFGLYCQYIRYMIWETFKSKRSKTLTKRKKWNTRNDFCIEPQLSGIKVKHFKSKNITPNSFPHITLVFSLNCVFIHETLFKIVYIYISH